MSIKITPTEQSTMIPYALVLALSETIRTLGPIPAGQLYASLMGEYTLSEFDASIQLLSRTGLVKETGFVLSWCGPGIDTTGSER